MAAQQQWKSITPNFSGSNSAMSNAINGINQTSKNFKGIHKRITDEANLEDAKALEQQRYAAGIAHRNDVEAYNKGRQKVADGISLYNAESKGYGQGDKVTAAMAGLTSDSNGVDNTSFMNALNNRYSQSEDPTLSKYVAQLDEAGIGSDKAESELGANYKDYIDRLSANEALTDNLNKEVLNNVTPEQLYKTDATSAKSAILKQLLDKGVNPAYATSMSTQLSQQYVQDIPKLTEYQKLKMKQVQDVNTALNKRVVTVKDSNTSSSGGGVSSSSKKGKVNGGVYNPALLPKDAGLKQQADVLKVLDAVSEDGKLNNYWSALSGERGDVQDVIGELTKPFENPKTGQKYYLSTRDIANYFTDKIENGNLIAGTTFNNIEDKEKIRKYREDAIDKARNAYDSFKKKGGGKSGTSSATHAVTTKNLSVDGQNAIKANNDLLTSIIGSVRPKSGEGQLNALIGKDTGIFKETVAKKPPVVKESKKFSKVKKEEELLKDSLLKDKADDQLAKLSISNPNKLAEIYNNASSGNKKLINSILASTKYFDKLAVNNEKPESPKDTQAETGNVRGGYGGNVLRDAIAKQFRSNSNYTNSLKHLNTSIPERQTERIAASNPSINTSRLQKASEDYFKINNRYPTDTQLMSYYTGLRK